VILRKHEHILNVRVWVVNVSIQSGKPTPNGLSLVVRAQPAAGRTSDAGGPEETNSKSVPGGFSVLKFR
jgi:hypothetical protein